MAIRMERENFAVSSALVEIYTLLSVFLVNSSVSDVQLVKAVLVMHVCVYVRCWRQK